jgi:hypothetical protein
VVDAARPREEKTPWNPSRTATARVTNPLPAPTACPHCSSDVELVGNERIYGMPYGEWPYVYRCKDDACGSYVGLHPFTAIPLGTLADAPTRDARKKAKALFNPLWQSGGMDRKEAYAWLARELGIPVGECHVGWFDVATCERVVGIIKRRPASRKTVR